MHTLACQLPLRLRGAVFRCAASNQPFLQNSLAAINSLAVRLTLPHPIRPPSPRVQLKLKQPAVQRAVK